MDMKGFNQYKEQSINTMTQGELLLLLYDELYKRLAQAELTLEKQEYPVFENCVDRAVAIIQYLDDTLDRKYDISQNLTQLYEYFTYELGRGEDRPPERSAGPCKEYDRGAAGRVPAGAEERRFWKVGGGWKHQRCWTPMCS